MTVHHAPRPPSPSSAMPTAHLLAARYLVFYNVSMAAGWVVVLLRLVSAVLHNDDVYAAVHLPLKIFQTGAVLEIIHSLTGLIRAPWITTSLQVCSRLQLVWGVLQPVAQVRQNVSLTTMVLAWSLTEIPRYFYFSVAAVSSHVPFWVTFMRYSTFIPLYPMGAGSEWLTLYSALPSIKEEGLFSARLPNRFNVAFDYYSYCVMLLLLYFPGLPHMYYHMLRQRRKYVTDPVSKLAKAQ